MTPSTLSVVIMLKTNTQGAKSEAKLEAPVSYLNQTFD